MSGPVSDKQLNDLIDHLLPELKQDLETAVLAKIAMAVAAFENLIEILQPEDVGRLRLAAAHLVLNILGVTDIEIERQKALLLGMDTTSLDRRN